MARKTEKGGKFRNKAFTKKEIHAIITNNETDCTKEMRK